MEAGRRWAIETFGAQGVHIRNTIPQLVRDEFVGCADAQDAWGHRSGRVFGQFWEGILERFEAFGSLPGATLKHPGRASYWVAVVNGVAIFPWRYSADSRTNISEARFLTSPARGALLDMGGNDVQGSLDLGLREPDMSGEEAELARVVESAMTEGWAPAAKLVVVAIACSRGQIDAVHWGDVALVDDRRVDWANFSEDLLPLTRATLAPVADSSKGFATGEPPTKLLQPKGEGDKTGASERE